MNATSRSRLGVYLAFAATCGLGAEALAATLQKVPLPRPRPPIQLGKPRATPFRRGAENALWNDGVDARTVRAFFAKQQPATAKGRYMLARTLLTQGDRDGAGAVVRYAWRYDDASAEVEKRVLDMYGSMLTAADHKVRMERRFYADDVAAGMRAAARLGGGGLGIGRARAAVQPQAGKSQAS